MDHPSIRVDVFLPEPDDFSHAKPCGIGQQQNGSMLHVGDGFEDAKYFAAAEHARETMFLPWARDAIQVSVLSKCFVVEKLDRTDALVDVSVRTPLNQEIGQIGAQLGIGDF